MSLYAPDDYAAFRCLMGRCAHTCCAGWEIDVDEEARALYEELEGPIGERVRAGLFIQPDGTASFRLDERERCPLLDEDGLCALIREAGEGTLCDTCREHPRFYTLLEGRWEVGLGLCCEAAARQCVERAEPFRLVEAEVGEETLSAEANAFLTLRDGLFRLAEDPALPWEAMKSRLLARLALEAPEFNAALWRERLSDMELLDAAWPEALDQLIASRRSAPQDMFRRAAGNLTVYFLHRHLTDGFLDDRLPETALFCLTATDVILAIAAALPTPTLDDLADIARRFSAEIEYSDRNLSRMLTWVGQDIS